MTDVISPDRRTVAASSSTQSARRQRNRRWKPVLSQTLLTIVLLLFLMPFVYMIGTALKPAADVFKQGASPIGSEIRWSNFTEAWTYLPFGRFILNSIFVSVSGTLVVCATSILSAYAFARLSFRGRDKTFLIYLATLMLPQEVVVVPMFILMQEFGWVDSYAALILPWAFTAFGTFLLRQFYLTIPREMDEAAVLDGASRLQILFRVIVPIARPAIAVLAVFTFINYWNSFLWPLIVINTREKSPVPLGLNLFLSQNGNQWHLLMAASTISMVPTVTLVLLLQRHLVRGIAMSGLGGK